RDLLAAGDAFGEGGFGGGGELCRFAVSSLDNALGLDLGFGDAFLHFDQFSFGFLAQLFCRGEFGRDLGGAVIQRLGDRARHLHVKDDAHEDDQADERPEGGVVEVEVPAQQVEGGQGSGGLFGGGSGDVLFHVSLPSRRRRRSSRRRTRASRP